MMPDWLSLVDLGYVAIVALFAWGGFQKGFAGQVAHLLTFIIMGVLLFFVYPPVFTYFGRVFRGVEETYLMWLILAGLFLLGVGVYVLISKLLAGLLKTQISDGADHGWGLVLGLSRGVLVALFAMMLLVMLDASGRIYNQFSMKSKVGQLVCHELVPRVQPHLSRAVLEEKVNDWRNVLLDREEAGQLDW